MLSSDAEELSSPLRTQVSSLWASPVDISASEQTGVGGFQLGRLVSGPLSDLVQREVLPLPHSSVEYKKWAPVLMSMAADYRKTYITALSQMGKGSSPDRFPCCNPGCTPMPICCKCN